MALAAGCVGGPVRDLPALVPFRSQGLRLHGEHGLFVIRSGDTLRVSWLTRAPGAGWAQLVEADGTVSREVTTRGGAAHAATFLHAGTGTVMVRYGARDDPADRHETAVRLSPPARPPVTRPGVDSIYVTADIHGELDTLLAVLRSAGVVDREGQWSAGRAHLVVAGDMMSRGADVTALLWFLYGLEPQAEAAGGALDIVLGNHEIMVMLDDLRYVHEKEAAVAAAHGVTYDRMFDPRRSVLGAWLVSKPALLRIDDVLVAHGGLSDDWLGYSLQAFDDTLAAYTSEDLFHLWADLSYIPPLDSAGFARRNDFFWGERSVFWYRGYALEDDRDAELHAVLRHHGARVHVVGHTPDSTILERYDGALVLVNTIPFAAELLLLERAGDGWRRWRIRSEGPPERL